MFRAQISCGICSIALLGLIASVSTADRRTPTFTASVSRPTRPTDAPDDWDSFVTRFGKKYKNKTEENERRAIRQKNLALIIAHNEATASGKHNFTLRENFFVDWTDSEYKQLLGFKSRNNASTTTTSSPRRRRFTYGSYPPFMPTYYNTVNVNSLPSCVNWTAIGWVGAVMNQGRCGSCWSYSATGSLQSQYYNYSGKLVQMSQQNLIDCSTPEGNQGCNGGNMQNAFWYVQTNGIESLAAYPDTSAVTGSSSQPCAFNASLSITKISSWRNVASGSESALQQAVALVGPVSAGIDASSLSFQYYGGGVYSSTTCGSSDSDLDHAVLVVGYGVYNGEPYWLLQNSWGTSWGINGYMMLARNDGNMCGIATDATFPVIAQSFSPAAGVNTNGACLSSSSPGSSSGSSSDGSSSSSGSISFTATAPAASFHAFSAIVAFTMLLWAVL